MLSIHSLVKNAAWIFSGLLFAQIINFLFALVLPRIYAPEDFALFGLFLSSVMILFEIVNFRLDHALMLPNIEEESIYIYRKAIFYGFILAFIVLLIGIVTYFNSWLTEGNYIIFWIALSIFLQGIIQPTFSFCNRIQSYTIMNIARIGQAIGMGLVSCIPYFIYESKVWLIEGFVFGQFIVIIVLYPVIFRNFKLPILKKNYSLASYSSFPKYGVWSSLLNTISRNSVVYLLNFFFVPYYVGLYTFNNKLIQAPLSLVTSSIGQVFFRDASQTKTQLELKSLSDFTQKILTIIAIAPICILWIWGPDIFEILFGKEWREAGEIARYLSLWYGTSLIVTPLSMLIDIKAKLKWELSYNILFFIFRVSSLCIVAYFGNFKWTIIIFGLVSVFFNLYLLIFVRRLTHHENKI
ncbi:MAG: oligosaccharide flippase family protein [Chitinophagales bacterium]|nr:oligosaccharide flippase family protein [Chitinophagales bacterium]